MVAPYQGAVSSLPSRATLPSYPPALPSRLRSFYVPHTSRSLLQSAHGPVAWGMYQMVRTHYPGGYPMARLSWTHDSGETDDGICAACDDDSLGDDETMCGNPVPDYDTTAAMGDLPEGSAYCYCGHVLAAVR